MDEYIKYKGNEVKIGTLANLYYTNYQKYQQALKEGHLSGLDGNELAKEYVRPDSGFRFRFPFRDEDKLSFGNIGDFDHDRGCTCKNYCERCQYATRMAIYCRAEISIGNNPTEADTS